MKLMTSPTNRAGMANSTTHVNGHRDKNGSPDKSPSPTLSGMLPQPKQLWQVQNRENYVPLKLYHPYDVSFLWDDRVVLVEGFYPYSRIQVLDRAGQSLKSIAQGEVMPYGVTVDAEGYIAITDHKDRTVKFFTPDGKFGLAWKENLFDWPDGIASTSAGHYVVTDWTQGMISIHDIDGIKLREFSSIDRQGADYSCPAYVTIDKRHRILITDTFDHTVKVFDPSGQLLLKFHNYINSSGAEDRIKDPRGITIDVHGNIVVAEWGGNRISMFSPDGRFIRHLLAEEEIKYPWGVAASDSGLLLMSEQKLNAKPALKMYQCYN